MSLSKENDRKLRTFLMGFFGVFLMALAASPVYFMFMEKGGRGLLTLLLQVVLIDFVVFVFSGGAFLLYLAITEGAAETPKV